MCITTATMTGSRPHSNPLALLRLCQLVSPALPVGAYAYSQGLEYAVHAGWVHDETSTYEWLLGMEQRSVATLDLPVLVRLYRAWADGDAAALVRWTSELLASRETEELRAEERHLGAALARVLSGLGVDSAQEWMSREPVFCTMFALAAVRWEIAELDTVCGYVWSWLENQTLAAMKLVPLGQSAGQRLLHRAAQRIPHLAQQALVMPNEAIGAATAAQGLASALHETQYSRLFRS